MWNREHSDQRRGSWRNFQFFRNITWMAFQSSRKIKEECSEVLNKIIKRKTFQYIMLHELFLAVFDHLYLLSKCLLLWQAGLQISVGQYNKILFFHINYMFLVNEQPCILSAMKPHSFCVIVLSSSRSTRHLLFIKRTGEERVEDYHKRLKLFLCRRSVHHFWPEFNHMGLIQLNRWLGREKKYIFLKTLSNLPYI